MAVGLPTLIIGIGGTGLHVLQRVKERLIEAYYGEVPPQITLLEFDTALQSLADNFVGVQLSQHVEIAGGSLIHQEMQIIQPHAGFTLKEVMDEARGGAPRWSWMEVDKLDRLLPHGQRSVLNGPPAAIRPVGRVAFFANYHNIAQKLRQAMQQVMHSYVETSDAVNVARAKRNVFLVGSLAGGTGSGGFIDLAVMIRNIKQFDSSFNDIVLIGIIALPRFFANTQDELGRRVPNTYAGLRELDRFMRAHKSGTPYKYVGGHGEEVTINNQLLDLCYLVDVEDYAGRPAGSRSDLGGLPAIADMIVAHTDLRLGLRLNAANINVTANFTLPPANPAQPQPFTPPRPYAYQYQARCYYSALNCHTIIFPREDVSRSLGLRFLIDLMDSHIIARDQRGQLIVPADPIPVSELIEFLAKPNPTIQERMAAKGGSEGGEISLSLGVFAQAILKYAGRRFDTSPVEVMSWLVEDVQTRKLALEVINRSMEAATTAPADPTSMTAYVNRVRVWQEKYLGQLVDPNNPFGERTGGAWEQALGDLVVNQRRRMESSVRTIVLSILNQRQEVVVGEEKTSLMRANRLNYALTLLRKLKDSVRGFIKQADLSFGETARNLLQLRRDLEEERARVLAARGPFFPLVNPNPGPAYLHKLREVGEAECRHLLRNLAVALASQLGGDIVSEHQPQSVLDTAIQEIERWATGLDQLRELIAQERRRHEARRKEKYAIGVRSYITDPQKFPRATEIEDELYRRYKPVVLRTLIGPDVQGKGGAFRWVECDLGCCSYQITTKVFSLTGAASDSEEMAREWQAGIFRLMAEQIRGDTQARVSAYLPSHYVDQEAMLNTMIVPNSRALIKLQGAPPSERQRELYLAVDPTSDDLKVNEFYSWFGQKWRSAEHNQDYLQSESDVNCTLLTLYHGIELDHVYDFNAGEKSYRAIEQRQGCLHLFPEERLAADYEAQIPTMKRSDWGDIRRLHPEVVMGLRDQAHVRGFVHALVSGLIAEGSDGHAHDLYLTLPAFYLTSKQRYLLSRAWDVYPLSQMGPNDQIGARVLQAFHTYTLIGRPIDDKYAFERIDHGAVERAFQLWFTEHHQGRSGAELDQLIKEWETSAGGMIAPLFLSEGKDPRFRDLGIVLMIELRRWRQLFNAA